MERILSNSRLALLIILFQEDYVKSWKLVFYVVLVVVVVISVYDVLNRSGLIRHSGEAEISTEDEWAVGEYRTCTSLLVQGIPTNFLGQDGSQPHLSCSYDDVPNSPHHAWTVHYWGRVERQEIRDIRVVSWKCQKRSDGLTCWARN